MIITGKDDEQHLDHLEKVLRCPKEHGLQANRDKCEFFQTKITYCRQEVDQHRLHKTQEKVDAGINAQA